VVHHLVPLPVPKPLGLWRDEGYVSSEIEVKSKSEKQPLGSQRGMARIW
jgi:hypothetical protein